MKRSIRWMEKRRRKEAIRVRLLCDELASASSRKQFWARTIEIEQRRRRPRGIWALMQDIENRIERVRSCTRRPARAA